VSKKDDQASAAVKSQLSHGDLWDMLGLYPAELDPLLIEVMSGSPVRKPLGARRFVWALAASLVMAVGTWLWILTPSEPSVVYETNRGERIVVNLSDGSSMHVNSDSRVKVSFNSVSRIVNVITGEALFDVRKDAARKFIVTTDRGSAAAVGTQFNVNLYSGTLIVTIAEGTVLVSNDIESSAAQAAEMAHHGYQVSVEPDGQIRSQRLDSLLPSIAWTEGKIMFSGESLDQAIRQVNRYSLHRISILDARLRKLRIYGVFNTGDYLGFLAALKKTYNIDVTQHSAELTYLVFRDRGK
jgi:transmembrane sensor